MKKAIVLGAGGFIGTNLVNYLKTIDYHVRGVDMKYPKWSESNADEFILADLRNPDAVNIVLDSADEVYQLAADMGGAEFVFTGKNDADIFYNNAMINLNVARFAVLKGVKKLFFSSSACVYPYKIFHHKPVTSEDSAYPAWPDSEYGWEKLMSERLYFSYMRNYHLNIRIARFHNIFGPLGSFEGGREKAPAALCRKVIEAEDGGSIEIIGDGKQTRSFLHITAALGAIREFMDQDETPGPVNIGSSHMVTINELADMAINISGKTLTKKYRIGEAEPVGVLGRTSDNDLFFKIHGFSPGYPLKNGLTDVYKWINSVIENREYIYERNPDSKEIRKRPI